MCPHIKWSPAQSPVNCSRLVEPLPRMNGRLMSYCSWWFQAFDGQHCVSLNDSHQPSGIRRWSIVVHDHSNTCAPTLQFCSIYAAELVASEVTAGQEWCGQTVELQLPNERWRLNTLELLVSNSKQQWVTVVKSTGNKCMNQHFECIRC